MDFEKVNSLDGVFLANKHFTSKKSAGMKGGVHRETGAESNIGAKEQEAYKLEEIRKNQ